MKRTFRLPLVLVLFLAAAFALPAGAETAAAIFTGIQDIQKDPSGFQGKLVSVRATFQGWKADAGAPPVTRSDWVAQGSSGNMIYCTGRFPARLRPDDPEAIGRKITVLGRVEVSREGRPFIAVSEALPFDQEIEQMVAVSQIIFDPIGMQGKRVAILGVLAKGFGPRGNRIYFIADPTGAITLDRLPKLYPKGTILQIRGTVTEDREGLPILGDIEIVSAKP